jgi:hypothetical protein
MTTTFDSAAHPRGHASNAGSFSDKPQTSPELTLGAADQPILEVFREDREWGIAKVEVGSRTPWGAADHVDHVAPGIAVVGTPSHGGVKLSPERNRLIPKALRQSSGWYEEDCEAAIPGLYFPSAWPHWSQDRFEESVKRWSPDAYEEATGRTVLPGESSVRDEKVWADAHANDYVVRGGSADERPGFKRVKAHLGDGTAAEFLVPVEDLKYGANQSELGQSNRLVIDPARHERLEPLPEPERTPAPLFHEISTPATPSARARLANDLAKRWRRSDGRVETLRDIVERGVSGKSSRVEEGKRIYSLHEKAFVEDSSYSAIQVTKATFDAVQAPDERTPVTIAYQNAQLAQHAFDRAIGWDEQRRLRARLAELDATVDRLRAEEAAAK